MLAQKFEDRVDGLSFPLYTQPKLDGVRCIVYMQDGELVAKSRQGKPIDTVVHILEELKPFFEQSPNAVLDGELYNHDYKNDFNKIISLVRKMKPPVVRRILIKLSQRNKKSLQFLLKKQKQNSVLDLRCST